MMHLNINDIEISPGSVVDPAGKVFIFEDRIFRAITKEYVPIYQHFLHLGGIKDIFAAGLIETWVADISLEGFELILEHKKIPEISYWPEWCSLMAKEAAITTCKLNIELAKRGYITKDTGLDNLQFVNGTCQWIDFGSVVPIKTHGAFRFNSFRYQSILPLWLWSKGYRQLASAMYKETSSGYLTQMGRSSLFRRIPLRYHKLRRKAYRKTDSIKILEDLLDYVERLNVAPPPNISANNGNHIEKNEGAHVNDRYVIISKVLERFTPSLLLVLAGHLDKYAELAISKGFRVISLHENDVTACLQFENIKNNNLPNLSLIIDLLEPTPPSGYSLGIPSAYERCQGEITLAIDVVHQTVLKKHVYFEPILRSISNFTKKVAIIEFVPREDPILINQLSSSQNWYSLATFVQTASRYFNEIEVIDFSPSPRKLLICTK